MITYHFLLRVKAKVLTITFKFPHYLSSNTSLNLSPTTLPLVLNSPATLAPLCFSNTPGLVQPQGLCTYFFSALNALSPNSCISRSLISFISLLKILLSRPLYLKLLSLPSKRKSPFCALFFSLCVYTYIHIYLIVYLPY